MKDKLIAITGAASGIGRATAQLLASHGAILSLADANEESLQQFESELKKEGVDVITQKVDVRVRTEVDNWIGKTVEHFSRPIDGNRPTPIEFPPKARCWRTHHSFLVTARVASLSELAGGRGMIR